MKIYLDSNYAILKVEDSRFVANSSGYDNKIQFFFLDGNGTVYKNTEPSYVGLAFRRNDGNKILNLRCALSQVTKGWCWEYTTAEQDGVLAVKGALEISAQFVKTVLTDGVITSRQTQGTVVVTSYVQDNIGKLDEDWYAQNSENNQNQHDALQSQITGNASEIATLEGQVAQNTTKIEQNRTDINSNDVELSNHDTRITDLEENRSYPETYIGQTEGTVLPTNDQLTLFVVETVARQPRNGDVIIFILQISGATDKNYKYTYNINGWKGYEIPPLEKAGNGSLGIVQGTYSIGENATTLVDIVGGKIKAIYVKNADNTYTDIRDYLNTHNTQIKDIISGAQAVGKANKAVADQLGNIINTYYLSAIEGATKQYVKDYALPKSYAKVYYYEGYTNGGQPSLRLSETVPTTPESGIQLSKNLASLPEEVVAVIDRVTQYDYEYTKNSAYKVGIYVSGNSYEDVRFKLKTEVFANDGTLIAELDTYTTDSIYLNSGAITKINIQSNFNSVGAETIEVPTGSTYKQTLSIIRQTTRPLTLDIYCNATYTSTFALDSTPIDLTINYVGEPKQIRVNPNDFTLVGNEYQAVIPQTVHKQPSGYKYLLTFYTDESATTKRVIAFDYKVADNGDITLISDYLPDGIVTMLIASSARQDIDVVGGTEVYVDNVKQTAINFDSDPQTQLDFKQPKLSQEQLDNIENIDNKQNAKIRFYKDVDASELADIVDLESFYSHFYALRKSAQRKFMIEYSTTDTAFQNVIDALGGYPAQLDATRKAVFIIDLPISEAGGFEINVQAYNENKYPKIYQDVKGWITNYIVSTGWYQTQKKLTAGENITIDENNVISASGGGSGETILYEMQRTPDGQMPTNAIIPMATINEFLNRFDGSVPEILFTHPIKLIVLSSEFKTASAVITPSTINEGSFIVQTGVNEPNGDINNIVALTPCRIYFEDENGGKVNIGDTATTDVKAIVETGVSTYISISGTTVTTTTASITFSVLRIAY